MHPSLSLNRELDLRLMVSNEDSWAGPQVLFALDDKLHACRPAHGPLKASRNCPLAQAAISHAAQGDGCDNSIPGAENETGKRGEDAGVEPGGWDCGCEKGKRQDGGCVDDQGGDDEAKY